MTVRVIKHFSFLIPLAPFTPSSSSNLCLSSVVVFHWQATIMGPVSIPIVCVLIIYFVTFIFLFIEEASLRQIIN